MFTSDVTQTYNHLDASAEILIMLLGSFLLGCFLCWILRNFFINTKLVETNNEHFDSGLGNKKVKQTNIKSQTTISKTAVNNKKSNKLTEKNKTKQASHKKPSLHKTISDFKIINGITPDIENLLRNKNINSYSDLRDIDNKTLNEILRSLVINDTTIRQTAKTWSHQAALAAKGDWRKLSEYQDFVEQAMKSDKDFANTHADKDNLQKIKGIGPQIEKILNSKGIYSFKQLRKADAETLKEYIANADQRFKNNQTATWSHQASMAEKNQWKELTIYQEFMDDIKIDSDNLAATINKTNPTTDSLNLMEGSTNTGTYTSKTNTTSIKNSNRKFTNYRFESNQSTSANLTSDDKLPTKNKQKSVKNTDHNNMDSDADKETENKQHNIKNSLTDKSSKNRQLSNSKSQKDDLKIIEGIGPKIEEVLNEAKIFTFHDLQHSNRDTLKSLLNAAGPQYRMHEPETWPVQAEIAKNKEWDKLKEYQEFLTGGREKR